MINKRGKIIAVGGAIFFTALIVIENMKKDGISKDSFYETYTSDKVQIAQKQKKTASIQVSEEEIMESSESYKQTLKSNKKDKAFSLYREILESEETKVEETITEISNQEKVQYEPVQKKEPATRVVYIEKPVQQQLDPTPEKKEEKRTFTRLASDRSLSTAKSNSNNETSIGDGYIKAEIYQAINVDMAYPGEIDIRVLESSPITLPDGKVIQPNTMMKGIPSDGSRTLNIYIPEYNLHVYDEKHIKGIPLTASEGIRNEADRLAETEVESQVNVPIVGSVKLSSGKRRTSRKVKLNASRTIWLKWER